MTDNSLTTNIILFDSFKSSTITEPSFNPLPKVIMLRYIHSSA